MLPVGRSVGLLATMLPGVPVAMRSTQRYGRYRRHLRLATLVLALLVAALMRAGALGLQEPEHPAQGLPPATAPEQPTEPGKPASAGVLSVHVLDVGQADAITVRLPDDRVMLVDAGTSSSADTVTGFLQDAGVEEIAFLVITHPHEDHIGGAIPVLTSFSVGEVFMPRTSHTTKTYENLLLTLRDKALKVTEARSGVQLVDSPDLSIRFLGPVKAYAELNDWSAVLAITYGEVTFVLAGDAMSAAERDMLEAGLIPDADVLKVGHHGSKTSTGDEFLKALTPSVAVISVGKDNSYGCPDETTLQKLAGAEAAVYRTDIHGTVTVSTDGETLTVKTEKGGL